MKKKFLYFVIPIILVIVGLIWYFLPKTKISQIDSDTTIAGDYLVEEEKVVVIRNGAKLTVNGNLIVRGEISCLNGPLNLIVKGNTTIENKLICERLEELSEEDTGVGISIVSGGSFTMTESSKIITNGHLQIVDKVELLTITKESFAKLYEKAAEDSGEGNRMGPFIKKEETSNLSPQLPIAKFIPLKNYSDEKEPFPLIQTVSAQGGPVITITGELTVKTPPKGVNQIIILDLPDISTLKIKNFWLKGPDARKGDDDKDKKCNAQGKDGQNALRLLVQAPNIKINNFILELGSGGDGGDAITKKDECLDARATGGDGGQAGNFKIIGSNSFDIEGLFTIHPGAGGNGGSAEAYGKNGGAGENGGNATAKGGDAENNEKAVRAIGTISGKNNIKFGSMTGGNGGSALAVPGNGGDGTACKSQKGGDGGKGVAEGGNGGNALIFLAGAGAGRTDDAEDIAGNGGSVSVIAAKGGNGSVCNPKKRGGDGGKGGEARAIPGSGGVGGTKNGEKGQILNQRGGDGGNGGDGCSEGIGGLGGFGSPLGNPGKSGKNLCEEAPPEPSPTPPAEPPTTIHIEPLNLTFEHQIGSSPCPQLIGSIYISKDGAGPANKWKIQSTTLPPWLSVVASGSVPQTLNLNFNCTLTQYVTQTLSATLNFQLTDEADTPVGNIATLNITGYISAQ